MSALSINVARLIFLLSSSFQQCGNWDLDFFLCPDIYKDFEIIFFIK